MVVLAAKIHPLFKAAIIPTLALGTII